MRLSARGDGTARALRRALALCLLLPALGGRAQAQEIPDPIALSLEELLEIKVYSASKFPQKTTEAPASVTIVTADDIRAYGHRTLADLLKSVRSLYVSYDRNYAYLGVRGFERPGDYDSRVLLLVDGYRLNDPIYDTAGIGTEFPLDVDLIERVEIVRGPGSSIYGSNAFFAVINVITRNGGGLAGLEAAAEVDSRSSERARLSYGGHDGGTDWLVSASGYRSEGEDLYFPEFDAPETNGGVAEGRDGDRYDKLFGRLSLGGATATAGYSRRTKQIPTGSYGTAFNRAGERTTDQWAFLGLRYEHALAAGWNVAPQLFFGNYRYDGAYPYDEGPGPLVVNEDLARAQWWAAEAKLDGRIGPHRLLAGVEYQDNHRQDQINFNRAPYELFLRDRRSSRRLGLYVEDETPLPGRLLLNAGLRYDDYSTAGGVFNPRVALVWSAAATTTVKALYGTAFRAPNNYELFYAGPPNVDNPELEPEHIRSYELIAEHALDPNFRLTADVYYNEIRDLIDQVVDPGDDLGSTDDDTYIFHNLGRVNARGAELEVERAWRDDTRLRASYGWQLTRDRKTGAVLSDSPRHLGKLNLSAPLPSGVRAGAELQYMSRRKTLAAGYAGTAVVANLTLTTRTLAEGLELSLGVYNLLDRRYADPARPEHEPIATIPQDGRSARVRLSWRY